MCLIDLANPVRVEQRFDLSGFRRLRFWRLCGAVCPLTTGRMAPMCSGPEAQHPPMIWAPIRFQFSANSDNREGVYSAFCRISGPELTF